MLNGESFLLICTREEREHQLFYFHIKVENANMLIICTDTKIIC